jgi:hypothetical protein
MKLMDTQNRSMVGTSDNPTKAITSFVRSLDPRMPRLRSKKSFTILRTTRKSSSSSRMAFKFMRLNTRIFCGSKASPLRPLTYSSSDVKASTTGIAIKIITCSRLRRFCSSRIWRCSVSLSVAIQLCPQISEVFTTIAQIDIELQGVNN